MLQLEILVENGFGHANGQGAMEEEDVEKVTKKNIFKQIQIKASMIGDGGIVSVDIELCVHPVEFLSIKANRARPCNFCGTQ